MLRSVVEGLGVVLFVTMFKRNACDLVTRVGCRPSEFYGFLGTFRVDSACLSCFRLFKGLCWFVLVLCWVGVG